MALPAPVEARLYYRCAFHRLDDARILLRADHTTGAVYLAGYGVECILKALVLANLAPTARGKMLTSFRGARAHDFEWLRTQYLESSGLHFPQEITKAFTFVADWSSEMRYLTRSVDPDDAEDFISAAERIIRWADGRM